MSEQDRTVSNPEGRPPDMQRQAWAMRYGLTTERMKRDITPALMLQLSHCKSDECRRLILGLSERSMEPLEQAQRRNGTFSLSPQPSLSTRRRTHVTPALTVR